MNQALCTTIIAAAILIGTAHAAEPRHPGRVAISCDQPERDPPVASVIAAALDYAGLTEGAGARWLRRLRWAALLPRLSARIQQTTGQTEYFDLRPEAPDSIDLNQRLGLTWQIHATWRLDRLLFDARELAAERTAKRFGKQRRQLTERIVRLYYDRQRLKAAGDELGDDDDPLAPRQRLCRVTALIDAFTGGWFSTHR